MGKQRIIFYSIFGVYQLMAFIFTIAIDTKDISLLLKLTNYVSWFKYLSFIGLILIIIDFIWAWRQISRAKTESKEFKAENSNLKARIYDFQETKNKPPRQDPNNNMDFKPVIAAELEEASKVLGQFLRDPATLSKIEQASKVIAGAIQAGGKVISCGNGGSHCDAMHFAEELTGRYRENRKALPAICISDPSHISCVSNDYGYDFIFSRYLEALGKQGDVLLAISTSGQSPNVIKAAETAKEKGMQVIALTGKDGGKLAPLATVELRVPHFGFADRIQEIHIKIIHILILLIERQVI